MSSKEKGIPVQQIVAIIVLVVFMVALIGFAFVSIIGLGAVTEVLPIALDFLLSALVFFGAVIFSGALVCCALIFQFLSWRTLIKKRLSGSRVLLQVVLIAVSTIILVGGLFLACLQLQSFFEDYTKAEIQNIPLFLDVGILIGEAAGIIAFLMDGRPTVPTVCPEDEYEGGRARVTYLIAKGTNWLRGE